MRFNYQNFYQRITSPFRHYPLALKLLRGSNRLIVWIMYLAYIVMLLWTGIRATSLLGNIIIIPGIGFLILSLIRQRINAPRPYEKFSIKPLISRSKTGDSMPSRHVFSATVIAMCGLYLNISWGIFLLVLAIMAAVIRVIGGVHFPRDVIVGFLWGMACGVCLFLA